MSKIKDVERKIRRIEGFTAQFLYLDGRRNVVQGNTRLGTVRRSYQ